MIQNISIIGGDLRIIKLIQMLKNDGFDISIYGIDNEELYNTKIYNSIEELLQNENIIISSIPFSKDGININAPFSKKEIKIKDIIPKIKNKKFISGGIKDDIKTILENNNVEIIDLLNFEELTILNTIPTAEGAIQIAMEQTDKTIYNSNILILGFGRVGKTVANRFKALGANIYCEARKEKDISWIRTFGYNKIYLNELNEKIGEFDIIINTIPSIIIGKEQLKNIKKECLIIDLASAPGGIDKNVADEMKIKYITALGLPGKVAPVTAAEFIKEILYKNL